MKIKFLNNPPNELCTEFDFLFHDSRFTAKVESISQNEIHISKIRLKEGKPYCENHPGACQNPHGKRRKGPWLEGKDWIEFNDLLNDFLDRWKIAANVSSAMCVIRKDMRRRINYRMVDIGPPGFPHMDWEKDGGEKDFRYCVGLKPPKTKFPRGTPGGSA